MDLIDELGIDSMDLATVALVLQDEYKIVIDEGDYPKLQTIRLIAEYVKKNFSPELISQQLKSRIWPLAN